MATKVNKRICYICGQEFETNSEAEYVRCSRWVCSQFTKLDFFPPKLNSFCVGCNKKHTMICPASLNGIPETLLIALTVLESLSFCHNSSCNSCCDEISCKPGRARRAIDKIMRRLENECNAEIM